MKTRDLVNDWLELYCFERIKRRTAERYRGVIVLEIRRQYIAHRFIEKLYK